VQEDDTIKRTSKGNKEGKELIKADENLLLQQKARFD